MLQVLMVLLACSVAMVIGFLLLNWYIDWDCSPKEKKLEAAMRPLLMVRYFWKKPHLQAHKQEM